MEKITELSESNKKIKGVDLGKNRGYGNAVRIGLQKCKNDGCDFAVCLHSDGQYPPESILEFTEYMKNSGCNILQGSRIASGTALSGGMPMYKLIAGKILTFFEKRVFGVSLTDFHSGFLLYDRKALNTIPFWRLSNSFDFDVEVIASGCALNLKIDELPIPTRYADEKSYLNPLAYGLRVVWVMVKYLFNNYRRIQ
jgi:glycosyltransferase involved in cell wall biosynthesis